MLLETNYRERLLTVYNEVKKRLDYQIAVQQLTRRKEQDHMINWIEKNVAQSITAQQVLLVSELLAVHCAFRVLIQNAVFLTYLPSLAKHDSYFFGLLFSGWLPEGPRHMPILLSNTKMLRTCSIS